MSIIKVLKLPSHTRKLELQFGVLDQINLWERTGSHLGVVKYYERCLSLRFGGNDSFITLVPKIKDPLMLIDYRPIHLLGCFSKTISKVLVERLKLILVDIICPKQTTFISGRNILDGPLIVTEIIS